MDTVKVQIDADLTAAQLDCLLLDLSIKRARMTPGVPSNPPENIPTVRSASFTIDIAPDSLTMNFRSNGFGWLGYRINQAGVDGLRDLLNAHFPAEPGSRFGQTRD